MFNLCSNLVATFASFTSLLAGDHLAKILCVPFVISSLLACKSFLFVFDTFTSTGISCLSTPTTLMPSVQAVEAVYPTVATNNYYPYQWLWPCLRVSHSRLLSWSSHGRHHVYGHQKMYPANGSTLVSAQKMWGIEWFIEEMSGQKVVKALSTKKKAYGWFWQDGWTTLLNLLMANRYANVLMPILGSRKCFLLFLTALVGGLLPLMVLVAVLLSESHGLPNWTVPSTVPVPPGFSTTELLFLWHCRCDLDEPERDWPRVRSLWSQHRSGRWSNGSIRTKPIFGLGNTHVKWRLTRSVVGNVNVDFSWW